MAAKAPRKPLLTEGRAESLRALLAELPDDVAANASASAGLQFLADLVAWRLADSTKAKLAEKARAVALSPTGIGRYTGLGRGRRPGKKVLATNSTNS